MSLLNAQNVVLNVNLIVFKDVVHVDSMGMDDVVDQPHDEKGYMLSEISMYFAFYGWW